MEQWKPSLQHSFTPLLRSCAMRVFVTGATGFVGQEILGRLHAAGLSIRILARDPESKRVQDTVSLYGAEVRQGNVLAPDSLAGALNGMHAVIHLVGIISEIGENTFENVHCQGTQNIVAVVSVALTDNFPNPIVVIINRTRTQVDPCAEKIRRQ